MGLKGQWEVSPGFAVHLLLCDAIAARTCLVLIPHHEEAHSPQCVGERTDAPGGSYLPPGPRFGGGGLDMDWVCSSPKSMLVVTEDNSREVWGHLSTFCLMQTLIRQPNQTKPNLWHAKLRFSLIPQLKNYIWETSPREASCIFLRWTFSSSGRVKYVAEQGCREGVEGRWEWAARAYQGVLTGNKHCGVYFPAWRVHDHTLQGTVQKS